jgi:hypothetical protein
VPRAGYPGELVGAGNGGFALEQLTIQGRLGPINPALECLSVGVVRAELGQVNRLSLQEQGLGFAIAALVIA